MSHLLLIVLLVSCGAHKPHAASTITLQEKGDFYAGKTLEKARLSGFVHSKCDDLLFNCLGYFSGVVLDYSEYERGDGRVYRDRDHSCFDLGLSGSDFSQDTMKGWELCLIKGKDLDRTNRTIKYLEDNYYIMGGGDISRTFMSPSQMKQLYAVRDYVSTGKPTSLAARDDSADGVFVKTGFEAHLQVLGIYIDSIVYGSVSDMDLSILKSQAERQPRNALFQAMYHRFTDGDQSAATGILMDTNLFPNDRMPNEKDRSEDYLWQRDDDQRDWGAGDGEAEHFGVDFLFAKKVME
jgi:hypothetical protein